jgi:DNA (cytosine-5)-methyltransferase 1
MEPALVDLFCGIGIGSLGFVKAGFKIAAAVDIDADACRIHEANLGVAPIVGDLRQVTGAAILKRADLKRGELPLCVGCPPCQGFSSLRVTRLEKGQRDNRKSLLRVFARLIDELLPKVVILENVRGLAFQRNKVFFDEFVMHMRRLGYFCDYKVLDAADFGVPQHRHRLILIGSRNGVSVLPETTHSDPGSGDKKTPWKTVREAIGNLPPLKAGQRDDRIPLHEAAAHSKSVLEIIRNIPPDGGGRRDLSRRLWLPCHKKLANKKKRGAESIYGRMRWNAPSPTITTRSHVPSCGRFVHPTQDRSITLREAARLQSIPDDFNITGSKERVGQWIGNAFPLDLAESLGRQAISYV